jgi:hypothetical protein
MSHRPLILVTMTLGAMLACATAGTGDGSTSGSRDVLTRQEIDSLSVETAHEAVRRARSHWFRTRGSRSMRTADAIPVVVYVDGQRRGGIDVLHNIRASLVERIVYHNTNDATTRWGTNHGSGAIEVITRRRG